MSHGRMPKSGWNAPLSVECQNQLTRGEEFASRKKTREDTQTDTCAPRAKTTTRAVEFAPRAKTTTRAVVCALRATTTVRAGPPLVHCLNASSVRSAFTYFHVTPRDEESAHVPLQQRASYGVRSARPTTIRPVDIASCAKTTPCHDYHAR